MTLPDSVSDTDESYDIVSWLKEVVDKAFAHVDLESQRMADPNWSYEQVWIIPSRAVNDLPENPSFLDYIDAGAIFQGYQWVYHDPTDKSRR